MRNSTFTTHRRRSAAWSRARVGRDAL